MAIFTDAEAADNLLSALQIKKLNKVGYAYVLSQQASLYRYITSSTGLQSTGTVFIGDSALIANTREGFESTVLYEQLKLLSLFVNSEDRVSPAGYIREPVISLFSMNVGSPELASDANEVTFPGGTKAIPHFAVPVIRAMVNYVMLNPDSSIYSSRRSNDEGI